MRYLAYLLNRIAYKFVSRVGNNKLMNDAMKKIVVPVRKDNCRTSLLILCSPLRNRSLNVSVKRKSLKLKRILLSINISGEYIFDCRKGDCFEERRKKIN